MAGDRGIAFYGDERQELGPQELFDDKDARRAMRNLEFVAEICEPASVRVGLTPEERSGSRLRCEKALAIGGGQETIVQRDEGQGRRSSFCHEEGRRELQSIRRAQIVNAEEPFG